jgi:putative ABC transport system ATP-binding protein
MPSGKDVCLMTNWISWLCLPFAPARNGAGHVPLVRPLDFAGARKALLKARDLRHTFGAGETQTRALRGVSLVLHRGELTLIMGPSGSGKSTLLSVISGLMQPDRGNVVALGQEYWRLSRKEQDLFRLRHFGHVPQKLDLMPALTARQQIEMMLRWGEGLRAREAGRRTDAVLDRLGLLGKAKQRPDQLSGGEKQRVAIGRAIVKEPAFVFADEPTSALDKRTGLHVIDLLRRHAHERHASVVVVSHDPDLIRFADRVFQMEDGRVVENESNARMLPVRRRALAVG